MGKKIQWEMSGGSVAQPVGEGPAGKERRQKRQDMGTVTGQTTGPEPWNRD
jgi:hypothetical protein